MMMKRLTLMLCLALTGALAVADGGDLSAVSTLKVDLDAVAKLGQVQPVEGVTTAGQPDEASLKVFADNGYVAIVDLRTEGENRGLDEPAVVESLGMDYISFPIGRDGITFENARTLEDIMVRYDQPVLVHCGSANRVGALFALNAYRQTEDVEKALEAGRAAGLTGLESTVKEVLEVK